MEPRPDLKDKTLTKEVAESLLPYVLQWAKVEETPEHGSIQERQVLDDLIACMSDYLATDGYEMAKILEEDFTWLPNTRLVNLLDQARHIRDKLYDRRVEEWVQKNQVSPSLGVGDAVVVKHDQNERKGVIQAVHHKEARYQVACEDRVLGVPYEQVRA